MVQQRQFSRTFATGPASQLEVDLSNARLAVWGEDRHDVFVSLSLRNASLELDQDDIVRQAEAAMLLEGSRLTIREPSITDRSCQFSRSGLNLAVAFSQGFPFGRLSNALQLEYELRVPRDTELRIDSGNGSVAIMALTGPVRVNAGNGHVSIDDVERDVQVESQNGKVTVNRGGGALMVSSENGDIRVEQVRGPTEARTENGRITLRELAAGLRAESENGRIEYQGEVHGDFDLRTENVPIMLIVPGGSRFELDAESQHGSVQCDLPVRHERPASDHPAPRVRLHSTNGSIRIRELARVGVSP
jgi:hypothetical protein